MKKILENESQTPVDYKIAFIADTHNYYSDLGDLIKYINAHGPYAFVIVCGDLTNEGMRDEFLQTQQMLGDLNAPSLVVIGNHDLLSNGEKIYRRLYGQINFTFVYRDLTFVFVNDNNWESPGSTPDLTFIEDAFSKASTVNKILITHVAPNDKVRFSSTEMNELKNIVDTYHVNYIFNGHDHHPGEKMFGGAIQITIGAPSKRVYHELSITGGGLFHKKIPF